MLVFVSDARLVPPSAQIGLNGARALHDNMMASLLAAPMHFFDTTPVGRVLNRCARDMEALDQSLPALVLDLGLLIALFACNLLAVAAIAPPLVLCLAPLFYLFWRVQV